MKVTMKVTISGTRNGEAWPAPGGVTDLPDGEAQSLILAGHAIAYDESADVRNVSASQVVAPSVASVSTPIPSTVPTVPAEPITEPTTVLPPSVPATELSRAEKTALAKAANKAAAEKADADSK